MTADALIHTHRSRVAPRWRRSRGGQMKKRRARRGTSDGEDKREKKRAVCGPGCCFSVLLAGDGEGGKAPTPEQSRSAVQHPCASLLPRGAHPLVNHLLGAVCPSHESAQNKGKRDIYDSWRLAPRSPGTARSSFPFPTSLCLSLSRSLSRLYITSTLFPIRSWETNIILIITCFFLPARP